MTAFKKPTTVDYTTADEQTASASQKALLQAYESNGFFDESVVKTLEAYLAEQLTNSTVDIDANLALLKLYLVYPAHAKVENITSVLVKALTVLPSAFYNGALAIVPESFRGDDKVKQILNAGSLLQSARFEEFWKLDLAFADKVTGFTDAVRAFVLDALRKSHITLSAAVLKSSLNVTDVQPVVAAENWSIENDLIKVTPSEDNQVRPKKIQENINFEDILKVVHTLSK